MSLHYLGRLNKNLSTIGKVATVPLAPSRNAFLLIIKLNLFKLAEKLGVVLLNNRTKLSDLWSKLGGNFITLQNNIFQGNKVKSISELQNKLRKPEIDQCTPFYLAYDQELQKLNPLLGTGAKMQGARVQPTDQERLTAYQNAVRRTGITSCPVLGVNVQQMQQIAAGKRINGLDKIGEVVGGTAVASIIAAATPIVIATLPLIKGEKIDAKEIEQALKDPAVSDFLENNTNSSSSTWQQIVNSAGQIAEATQTGQSGKLPVMDTPKVPDLKLPDLGITPDKKTNNLLLLGIAGLGAFLLLRK